MVELGRGLVHKLALCQLAVGRDHGHVVRQKGGRYRHGRVEVTARVIAQVEHQAFELGFLFVDFFDLACKVFHRAFLELAQADPGVAGLDHLAAHRLGADFFARDQHRERAVFVLAVNRKQHLGVGLTAHALDAFAQRQTLDRGVVDLDDQVVGLDAGPKCGGSFDRRDHLDQPVFLRDLDADADKLAGGAFVEFLERLLVEVLRVRVQAADHAGDGVGDEFLVVHRLHIIALDHAEDSRELLQLFEWQRRQRAARHGLERNGGQGASDDTKRNPACSFQFVAHKEVHSVPQGVGLRLFTHGPSFVQYTRLCDGHSG